MRNSGDPVTLVTATAHASPSPACGTHPGRCLPGAQGDALAASFVTLARWLILGRAQG
jgi:hypothetical protein